MVGCQGQGRGKGEVHNSARVHCALNIGVDVQSVALHEFGHLAGLAHTTDDDAAMYNPYGGCRRTPHSHDVESMDDQYDNHP